MLVNICMKFHEDSLNDFKVLKLQSGRDIVLETAIYKVQRGITQKVSIQVMVLAFCLSSNFGLYLYEVSWRYLECFLRYREDTTISQNLLFSISKGHNSKFLIHNPVISLSAGCLMLLYICVKFHENISFFELEQTRFCEEIFFVTEILFGQGKNNTSPSPTGDIMMILGWCWR